MRVCMCVLEGSRESGPVDLGSLGAHFFLN